MRWVSDKQAHDGANHAEETSWSVPVHLWYVLVCVVVAFVGRSTSPVSPSLLRLLQLVRCRKPKRNHLKNENSEKKETTYEQRHCE